MLPLTLNQTIPFLNTLNPFSKQQPETVQLSVINKQPLLTDCFENTTSQAVTVKPRMGETATAFANEVLARALLKEAGNYRWNAELSAGVLLTLTANHGFQPAQSEFWVNYFRSNVTVAERKRGEALLATLLRAEPEALKKSLNMIGLSLPEFMAKMMIPQQDIEAIKAKRIHPLVWMEQNLGDVALAYKEFCNDHGIYPAYAQLTEAIYPFVEAQVKVS